MTATAFREWQLFMETEPVGGRHEDLRFGLLLSLLANVNRTKTSRTPSSTSRSRPRAMRPPAWS